MRAKILTSLLLLVSCCGLAQQPFLSESTWTAVRNESSGAAPYENLRQITRLHRVPATADFDAAAHFVQQRAEEYGLSDVHSEQFPIDGKTQYGLMRSYFAWQVSEGRLWEVRPQHALVADWSTDPIRLADYSRSADVEAPLIDVGDGSHESDYSDKQVSGKIVLADGVLSRVQALAIGKHGAAGIVSDMPNQSTAWSGLDRKLVRWGHLDARQPAGFAFMVSRETADQYRMRLRKGETIVLQARVQSQLGPGHWTVVSATIPGSDATAGEIVYSCHLDHERPGANDNGSGCVTILESARILAHLIKTGTLPPPRRTLRFVWGPEVEGTMAFLAKHPEVRGRLRADIHMDMVGGDPFKNKSMLHVTGTPWSLPSFVTDVGAMFAETIRAAAADYAENGGDGVAAAIEERAGVPGTRNEFLMDVTPYSTGSDHDDYDSSTIAVPSLYLRDWPDIYIHTDHDSLEQIDPTKLRRVALLGAASGYMLAATGREQLPALIPYLTVQCRSRLGHDFQRAQRLLEDTRMEPSAAWYEAQNLLSHANRREAAVLHSAVQLAGGTEEDVDAAKMLADDTGRYTEWLRARAHARGAQGSAPASPWSGNAAANRVPLRIGDFGPLTFQNDDVLVDRLGAERVAKIKLLNHEATPMFNVQDQSGLYAYEILNFVDGKRTVGEIRDAVAAEYGPIAIDLVTDYLEACAEAKIVSWK